MAEGRRFVCSNCVRAVEAWDEGNPYYWDERGEKRYAYHPDPLRERCTGNDTPALCLACGAEFVSDSAAPVERCPACASNQVTDRWELDGKACPYCAAGTFRADPTSFTIS